MSLPRPGPCGLRQAVDIGRVAVAVLRQALHELVVVVPHAETEHGKEHATVALAGNVAFEFSRVGNADVEIPVGGENHPIDAVLDEVLLGQQR